MSDSWSDVPIPPFGSPEHWQQRAKEARGMAEHMFDPEAREAMLVVAACYEKVAKRAEVRLQKELSRNR